MLLKNVRVFDPDSGVAEAANVLVPGAEIAAAGSDVDGPEPWDGGGGLLLPGLIDCHAHVAFPRGEGLPRSTRILEAVFVLGRLLSRGVTTVRDAWGADAGFKHALREGWIAGPDLLVSLRQLSPTGGLGDWWDADTGRLDRIADPALPDAVFDGPDQARAAVRRMVRAGADWIKLSAGGAMAALASGHDICPTDEELHAVTDEARRAGRDVLAHAHTAAAASAAASAGARSIEHGVFLDEAAITAMRDHGCWYVSTLAPIPPDHATAHRRSVALALEAGVPVAAGSDLAPRPHVDLLTELRLLATAGLGPARALRAATSDAARLLRLPDRGRIAPGLRADLVLLHGAAVDVTDLSGRIRAVWQAGHLVHG
ncbi:amidohydrolase family protein [Amycolatopsis sp. FDAARGOS 1241]|uniref:amidohydrolase family protein n=1 Tax=Amycolatopsis sp. FDAARGOS 1241 TaxID=2778070 RepID=UPI00194EA391|nr:amidohydrolase family protein [Amycolatopsis sp. FDAARGOS 1241]QRP44106.1 amidohydrolase family protein [Amycolatopsis sp. FDAARGOS 1241]